MPNLLVSAPPGSGKTELVSIQFPACLLAQQPGLHIISLANSDSLAKLASANVLRTLRSPQIAERWPLEFDKESEGQFTIAGNDGRPSLHAAGIHGQLTGHRADFLIFDDLLKSQSEAYSETIRERVWQDFSSAAETRLLPTGKIIGIQTRWHLDDPVGRLLRRAQEDSRARQFVYLSLSACNGGEDSFILDTRTHEKKYLPKYRALAKLKGQPFSFSRGALEGKRTDLGPSRWSALYMQSPVSSADALFPPECWGTYDNLSTDDIATIVTAWDCASKTGAKNDYSANVVLARLRTGGVAVLDVFKTKVAFSELPDLVLHRAYALAERYGQVPVLVVEDANAGTQLLQVIESRVPLLPRIAAKPVKAKIIRAEGVTPLTRGGLVALPREAPWRDAFISEMANFPVGEHDDVVDAFCHGLKFFVGPGDFRSTDLRLLPAAQDPDAALREHMQFRNDTAIGDTWDASSPLDFLDGDNDW